MTIAVAASGAQVHTVGAEHDLTTQTGAGSYQLAIDTSAMAAGEVLELRYYSKARSGDAEAVAAVFSVQRGGPAPLVTLPMFATPHYLRVTSTQVTGTSRTLPWAVYKA